MADNNAPALQIQRIYLKDLSLEQPNSPRIFLEQAQPVLESNLTVRAEVVGDSTYEVIVSATVTTQINDKVLFLIEAQQAGIFEIRDVSEDRLQSIIGVACPNIIYPYLRASVSDTCTRAGFPPVLLAEVNFEAIFETQRAEAAAGKGPSSN